MNPYNETFSKFYDRYFGDYAEKATPVLLHYFASKPEARTWPRVLDLGCGTGRLPLHFLEAGYSVTGLDLSPHMLGLAQWRCARHMVSDRCEFLQMDISGFKLEGPYGLALSTYNSLNHLDRASKLEGCFRSVRRCLAEGGHFLFDYHTVKGLREWVYSESTEWEEGLVKVTGSFNEKDRRAEMHLAGNYLGQAFDEILSNYSWPLDQILDRLGSSGFSRVYFADMKDLDSPLENPEDLKRVVVVAS